MLSRPNNESDFERGGINAMTNIRIWLAILLIVGACSFTTVTRAQPVAPSSERWLRVTDLDLFPSSIVTEPCSV
jgi:hypothetical protein